MQESLTKTFNKTAAAAYKAFPRELSHLVILLVPSSDTPVFVSPAIADKLTKDTAEIKKYVEKLAKKMVAMNAAGLASKYEYLADTRINLIALVDDKNIRGIFSERYTKEMRVIFNLDHEIGHHILKNGYSLSPDRSARQLAEGVSDAYAMLRHIQRFGNNTDHAGFYGESRAYSILYGDTEHYTTNTVQRTIQVADEMDISGLSLQETVKLAEKIALECRISSEALEKIRDAYQPVAQACKNHVGSPFVIANKLYNEDKDAYALYCEGTVAVMIRHRNDADIFRAGKQFLSYPPIRKFMVKLAETYPDWKTTLDFVDNHIPAQPAPPRKKINPGP